MNSLISSVRVVSLKLIVGFAALFVLGTISISTALANVSDTITEYPITTSSADPRFIVAGPDGNLWFTEYGVDQIGVMATDGTVLHEYPVKTTSAGVLGIAKGSDGNSWFTESLVDQIGVITTSGVVTEYPLATGSTPTQIVAGPDGNLWFTEKGTHQIGKITTAGVVVEYPPTTASSAPDGITVGADTDHTLWFLESGTNKVGRMNTSGVMLAEYDIRTAASGPSTITAGGDGNIWFTETAIDRIGRIKFVNGAVEEFNAAASSAPFGLVQGPPGTGLWMTEKSGTNVSRVGLDGVVTIQNSAAASSQPYAITVGPDNNLWFTEKAGNKIGKLVPVNPLQVTSTSPLTDGALTNPGTAYNNTLTASGGTTAYTWSLAFGTTLPDGLSLSSGGVISGTPTSAIDTKSFTVKVQDAHLITRYANFTLSVVADLPDLTGSFRSVSRRGIKLTGKFQVRNIGTQPAGASTLKIYLSKDGSLGSGSGARRLATRSIASLAVGAKAATEVVTSSKYGSKGKYLVACVNCDNAVLEATDGNNIIESSKIK